MERRFVDVAGSFGRLAAMAIAILLIGMISLSWLPMNQSGFALTEI